MRYLRFRQVTDRLLRNWFISGIGREIDIAVREQVSSWTTPVRKSTTRLKPRQFEIFGKRLSIDHPSDWNAPHVDKLVLYHLHYMDELNSMQSESERQRYAELLDRWIAENPVLLGNGWEPYPLSRRIVNWIKWANAGNSLTAQQFESLVRQVRVLMRTLEYHLLANHLFANVKALFFAGHFCQGAESDQWLNVGRQHIEAETAEQILDDGGHFERSPMYHALILEDILDTINVARTYDMSPPRGTEEKVVPMLSWLYAMTHPDGGPSYFNDAVPGMGASLGDLASYAARLGFDFEPGSSPMTVLGDSGYVRIDTDDGLTLIVDVGEIGPDYQPGHAHNDCLSFELSVHGKRTLVNTGISTYNANQRRAYERSTAAHNTVSIARANQSETWSAFRVGRRARPIDVEIDDGRISAGHDGWLRFGLKHHRRFEIGNGRLSIKDRLCSDSERLRCGTAHFHFHPSVRVSQQQDVLHIDDCRLSFRNARSVRLTDFDYCHGFNDTETSKKVMVEFRDSLESELVHAHSVRH